MVVDLFLGFIGRWSIGEGSPFHQPHRDLCQFLWRLRRHLVWRPFAPRRVDWLRLHLHFPFSNWLIVETFASVFGSFSSSSQRLKMR